jgi:hypothetical protein
MNDASLLSAAEIKTWQPTAAIRWRALAHGGQVLEQLWRCIETGGNEWRAVETVPGDDCLRQP